MTSGERPRAAAVGGGPRRRRRRRSCFRRTVRPDPSTHGPRTRDPDRAHIVPRSPRSSRRGQGLSNAIRRVPARGSVAPLRRCGGRQYRRSLDAAVHVPRGRAERPRRAGAGGARRRAESMGYPRSSSRITSTTPPAGPRWHIAAATSAAAGGVVLNDDAASSPGSPRSTCSARAARHRPSALAEGQSTRSAWRSIAGSYGSPGWPRRWPFCKLLPGRASPALSGEHYRLDGYDGQPKAIQRPHPLMIGWAEPRRCRASPGARPTSSGSLPGMVAGHSSTSVEPRRSRRPRRRSAWVRDGPPATTISWTWSSTSTRRSGRDGHGGTCRDRSGGHRPPASRGRRALTVDEVLAAPPGAGFVGSIDGFDERFGDAARAARDLRRSWSATSTQLGAGRGAPRRHLTDSGIRTTVRRGAVRRPMARLGPCR